MDYKIYEDGKFIGYAFGEFEELALISLFKKLGRNPCPFRDYTYEKSEDFRRKAINFIKKGGLTIARVN